MEIFVIVLVLVFQFFVWFKEASSIFPVLKALMSLCVFTVTSDAFLGAWTIDWPLNSYEVKSCCTVNLDLTKHYSVTDLVTFLISYATIYSLWLINYSWGIGFPQFTHRLNTSLYTQCIQCSDEYQLITVDGKRQWQVGFLLIWKVISCFITSV